MQQKEYADIIHILNHICIALQPFANSRNIKLEFSTSEKEIEVGYSGDKLLDGFSKFIWCIIDYMPDNNTLFITTEVAKKGATKYASIKIRNTGINLKQVPAITNNCGLPVNIYASSDKETVYEVCYSLSPVVVADTT